jgi:cytidine deaminase
MAEQQYQFSYELYDKVSGLSAADQELIAASKKATQLSYAPYSKFRVGAAARLTNSEIISGANQENASFPAGVCAERVLLGIAAVNFPKENIISLAISADPEADNDLPLAPCGICRQSLQEYAAQHRQPIRLLLPGRHGKIYVISDAAELLPFAFTSNDMK